MIICLLCSLALLYGWSADAWSIALEASWAIPANMDLDYFTRTLTKGLPVDSQPQWVMLYAFLQSFHYIVWVRLIPEDHRERQTPPSFRQSAHTLIQDFGPWCTLSIFLAMIGLAGWACIDLRWARFSYLKWISFHASLELAIISFIYVSEAQLHPCSHEISDEVK